jgi:hypothetical protein
MHYASDSELDVAVFRIGFVEYLAVGVAAPEDNLLTIVEIDGRRDVVGTDFTENVFPLSKYQAYELFYCEKLIHLSAIMYGLNAPRQFIICFMGIGFHIECVARVIDVVFYFFSKLASSKGFKCT